MSKPLPSQFTWSALSPPWSLPQLDANFTAVWNAVNDVGTYSNTLVDSGITNGIVANLPAGITGSLFVGLTFDVTVANTVTSTVPNLNFNSLGAKNITDPFGAALIPGAQTMYAGGTYRFVYDGTNFRVLNQTPALAPTISVHKTATTSRASNTTNANDPDLQMTLPVIGLWYVKTLVWVYGSTTGVMGFNCNLNYNGSLSGTASFAALFASNTGAPTNAACPQIQTTQSASVAAWNLSGSVSTSATAPTLMMFEAAVYTSTVGVLGFAWSQSSTNTNALNVIAGSLMRAWQS